MEEQPKLLLCIDDDEDDILLIEEAVLQFDSSMRFVAKGNGKQALMFLHRQKEEKNLPCLILLDINMPVMNGVEVLQALKNDEELAKIPIVIFSTYCGAREKLLCESFGIDMITKPNRVSEFRKVLAHLLVRCIGA
jgi:CheY-like chemotaxis protein